MNIFTNRLTNITRASGILLLVFICALPLDGAWEKFRDSYLHEHFWHPNDKYALLLEIGKEGDLDAIPFLVSVWKEGPTLQTLFIEENPEFTFLIAGQNAYAEVALAMLNYEPAWEIIEKQAEDEEIVNRTNAIKKLELIPGERGTQMLSSFIGDTSPQAYDLPETVEMVALRVLSKRLPDPPFSVLDLSSLDGERADVFFSGRWRKKWLKWRYENYGPITGREELFTEFVKKETKTAAEEIDKAHNDSTETPELKDYAVSRKEQLPQDANSKGKIYILWTVASAILLILAVVAYWSKRQNMKH